MSPLELRTFDLSRVGLLGASSTGGVGVDARREEHLHHHDCHRQQRDNDAFATCKVVKKLSLNHFRSKLIKHFDIAFHNGQANGIR